MTKRSLFASMLAMGVLFVWPLSAQDNTSPKAVVGHAVAFGVSAPLREIAKLPQRPHYGFHEANPVRIPPLPPGYRQGISVDPVEQSTAGPAANYSIGLNLLGVGNGFPGYSVPDAPPDTNMDVGDTQVVQWVNVSYAVFDKTSGSALTPAIQGNLLWKNLGGVCYNNNDGDIIAQWDKANHRWLLAQNTFAGSPYYACIAVSTSPDALGTYYLYAFSLGNGFPDYPKYGVWSNGYYQSFNNFGPGGSGFRGAAVCGFNSAKIIVGDKSAENVCVQLGSNDTSLLPGDIDSSIAPPPGRMSSSSAAWLG